MRRERKPKRLPTERWPLVTDNLQLPAWVLWRWFGGYQRCRRREEIRAAAEDGLIAAAIGYRENFGVQFATYAVVAIRRKVVQYLQSAAYRHRNREQTGGAGVYYGEQLGATDAAADHREDLAAVEDRDERRRRRWLLAKAVAALPELQWSAVVGVYVEGRTCGDLGRERGVSKNAVNHHIQTALRSLAESELLAEVE